MSSPATSTPDLAHEGDPVRRFPFRFDRRLAPLGALFGVRAAGAYVEVDDSHLLVRFGRWSLHTPLSNVQGTELTGPYRWWKVAGPAHVSLADQGVTFATNSEAGLCIRFHEPVPAALPGSFLRHPGATVTVADPHDLAAAITPDRPDA
jgi:hypothetical protein